jgi:beta-lactamase class A
MLRVIKIFMCGLALFMVFLPAYSVQGASSEEACDPGLQKGLEDCLTSLRLQKAVVEKSLSVALMDITDPPSPRMAYANPNEMMYAASLPKIAILLGAFERIFRGEMELNDKTWDELQQMIRYSSNEAATHLLQRVGKDFLANLLQSPRYRLYDPGRNGGLWVGKDYSVSPAWKRDPLHNLSHGATALQVARFYYLLETGGLVSPGFSRLMKAILGNPAINHKFVKGLRETHPDARIFRKSGTWKEFHSDSGIIEHEGYRYIAVALTRSPDGGKWLSDLIVQLDALVRRSGKPAEPNIPSVRLPSPSPYGVSIAFSMK